jgi:hypothetical protein
VRWLMPRACSKKSRLWRRIIFLVEMGYGGPRQSPVEKLVDVELMKQPVTQYPVTAEQCRDTLDLCGFVRRRLAFLSPLWHVGF